MAKQNEVSLSALNRARLRRQRPSAEFSGDSEDAGRDVMVPSFLWDSPQEEVSTAASWKEEPLPIRTRRSSARGTREFPPEGTRPRDREAEEERPRLEDFSLSHGERRVSTPQSGQTAEGDDTAFPEDATAVSEWLQPPVKGMEASGCFKDSTCRNGEESVARFEKNVPGDTDDTDARDGLLREPEFPAAEDDAGSPESLPDGKEDRPEPEAGDFSPARASAGGQRSRSGRTLAEDMELPEIRPDGEDVDGPSEAARASGEEDLRELRAALAAQGIPLRREQRRAADARGHVPDAVDEGRTEDIPSGRETASDAEAAVGQEEGIVQSPAETFGPADFAATPDAFLTVAQPPDGGVPPDMPSDGAAPAEPGDSIPPEDGRAGPPDPPRPPEPPEAGGNWLRRFFLMLALLAAVGMGLLLPYSFWWVYADGDVAVERAVATQAEGNFAIFGSGVSQDFVDYKLRLYAAVKPEIAVVGSSRVMQFRGSYFRRPFVNVGGTAGNLSVLRSTIDAMLRIHRPQVVIIGLDFWWFSENWQKDPFAPEPPTSGSYVYDLETLKAPWKWLLEGKIGWREFFAPLTGAFRDDRFGIMAQRSNDGFASDGSWHYTADVTGLQRPFDYQFGDTLKQVRYGIKAFAPAPVLSEAHLDAFAEIYCRLKSRGIQTYVFIAPLSATVLDAMRERQKNYPHLFSLYTALMERGIDAMDFTDPRKFGSSDCEFVDGFHGGEVTYTRILRDLVDRYHSLVAYVDVERINRVLKEWKGHATVYDERVTTLPEVDFMHLSCPKKQR